jgi:hypothetical protein
VLNPAVRAFTDANSAPSTRPPVIASPAGASAPVNSSASTATIPATTSTPEVVSTTRVVSPIRAGADALASTTRRSRCQPARTTSISTGKPRPPSTISTISTTCTPTSPTNGVMLPANSENPALQNADTAWNTASHSADASPIRGSPASNSHSASAPHASMMNVPAMMPTTICRRSASVRASSIAA